MGGFQPLGWRIAEISTVSALSLVMLMDGVNTSSGIGCLVKAIKAMRTPHRPMVTGDCAMVAEIQPSRTKRSVSSL